MIRKVRKGFTLVELLIVIVVIGILAAMMIFSSTEAMSSARAAQIIANMRNLKTAAIAWYADNEGRISFYKKNGTYGYDVDGVPDAFNTVKTTSIFTHDGNPVNKSNVRSEIIKYINGNGANSVDNRYQFLTRNYKIWYVIYRIDDGNNDTGKIDTSLEKKLIGRAKSTGLLKASAEINNEDETYFDGTYIKNLAGTKGKYVSMKIMTFN